MTKSTGVGRGAKGLAKKHGHTVNGKWTPEYRTWNAMVIRCTKPNAINWERYGGRGIRVCERWRTFANFLADMGLKPTPQHSIDRVNNDGNYEPTNCRWATRLEQRHNRRDVCRA